MRTAMMMLIHEKYKSIDGLFRPASSSISLTAAMVEDMAMLNGKQ